MCEVSDFAILFPCQNLLLFIFLIIVNLMGRIRYLIVIWYAPY